MSEQILTTGTSDFSGGVDSLKVPTIQSVTNPNGLTGSQLGKLTNGTMRDSGLSPRDGFQFRGVIVGQSSLPYLLGKTVQGKTTYVQTTGNPYEIHVIGGHVLKVDPTFAAAPIDLSAIYGLIFTGTTTKAYFAQAGAYLVIQSGNYNAATKSGDLPFFWNGTTLTQSNGITGVLSVGPNQPTVWPMTLSQPWTVPVVGSAYANNMYTTTMYPGNVYDVVTLTVSVSAPGPDAGDTIGLFRVTAIASTYVTLQALTLSGTPPSVAGTSIPTSDSPMLFILTAPSPATESVTLVWTDLPAATSGTLPITGNTDTLVFGGSPSYVYPGAIQDYIIVRRHSDGHVWGAVQVTGITAGTLTITSEAVTNLVPEPTPTLDFLQMNNVGSGNNYLNVPAAGNTISVPFSGTAPVYIGSIGDTIHVVNGATDYGTYLVTGYGQPAGDINSGAGVYLKGVVPATAQIGTAWPASFTLTVVNGPTSTSTDINQIPSALAMIFFMGRIWYANGKTANAGDIVGGPSGTLANNYQDSVLSVTENPLVLGGDGFTMPSGGDNITGFAIPQMINASLGQGLLNIGTANAIFALQVPVTRADWIAANAANAPVIFVVQQSNGFANDWSCVGVNGDIWFQSNAPDIRSLLTAVRYFQQWGNVDISSNEDYILSQVNPALLLWASGFYFNNRLWMTSLPEQTPYGVVHTAIIPLDLSPISTLEQQDPPNWEGNYEGFQIFQLATATFSGQQRAFATVLSENILGQIEVWESVVGSVGDNNIPIKWQGTFPGFTWGNEFMMKELLAGEIWLDEIEGLVTCLIEYSPDGSSCFYPWYKFSVCSAVDSSQLPIPESYPLIPFSPGVRKPITLPKPPEAVDDQNSRPASIGYEFQPRITFTGQCRLRGFRLHATERKRGLYEDLK